MSLRILVTGATGYIGGRLIRCLLEAGHRVRVLVRDPRRIAGRAWAGKVEIARGDLLAPASLPAALDGIDAAYYLVHSMAAGPDFEERDRQAARNFAEAARNRVPHVIYLGGLVPPGGRISGHLRSRAEVGWILRALLPVTEFRAGPIVGSGSASFEMVRYFTERFPIVIAPFWLSDNQVQPIAVRDILEYLVLALEKGPSGVVEVGSPDRPTFRQMLEEYARIRKLRRYFLLVPPVVPARLMARWVALITPIPASLAIPLIEGVTHPVVADTRRAHELFPEVKPRPYAEAVERALARIGDNEVETRWSGALGGARTRELVDREGLMREVRTIRLEVPPERVFASFMSLGGERGWLVWEWAWEIRGLIDAALGGPGLRRGRRHPTELLPGEALDFWRVEEVDPPHLLRLRAEMKVPGRAWLQWEAIPEEGGTRLVQTALFDPMGLVGALYWYLLYPIHGHIFSDMVRAIGEAARYQR